MKDSDPVHLWFASSEADRQAAFDVRVTVFVEEQHVPPEEELDDSDEKALHLLARTGSEVVGVSRLVLLDGGVGLVGRVAVLPAWRRRSIASRMLGMLEAKAQELGLRALELHAQTYVTELYARQGYAVTSGVFLEAGIEHVTMRKVL